MRNLAAALLLLPTISLGQVSYYFDNSVPYDESEAEEYIYSMFQVRPGDDCRVSFLSAGEYENRYGEDSKAIQFDSPCRIYFNGWYYPPLFGVSEHFYALLAHEIGHAQGLEHNLDQPESIMYPTVGPESVMTVADKINLWLLRRGQ